MKILVIGATGNTGTEIVKLATSRGHEVTAFVRSPHKIKLQDPRLSVKQGDPFDLPALSQAMVGQEAVLSTLGLPARQALAPSHFMAESAAAIVSAMTTSGVARLVILSAAVLFPGKGLQYRFFKWLLRHHARDLEALETVVAASHLDWTITRPPRLVHSEDARYVAARGALPDGAYSATFSGVARFMLDAAERREHVREIVGLVRPR